jgi:CO/xanthine dehydrogenase FAD-binding subunit
MQLWETYLRPTELDQALEALEAARAPARVMAGGTDLLLDIRFGKLPPPKTLIDVSGVREMLGIAAAPDGGLDIGAAVTHYQITLSDLVREDASCLVEACGMIGGPQVRTVATLGGNVAHALPAADGTIALLVLGAQAELASRAGRRWVRVEDLFRGPGETALDREKELIVRFRLPAYERDAGSAFARIMRPQGLAIAILNMAAWLQVNPSGVISRARLAVGPGGPRPRRLQSAEQALVGHKPDPDVLLATVQAMRQEVELRTSRHRATSAYRHHLLPALVDDVVPRAWSRALGDTVEMRGAQE